LNQNPIVCSQIILQDGDCFAISGRTFEWHYGNHLLLQAQQSNIADSIQSQLRQLTNCIKLLQQKKQKIVLELEGYSKEIQYKSADIENTTQSLMSIILPQIGNMTN